MTSDDGIGALVSSNASCFSWFSIFVRVLLKRASLCQLRSTRQIIIRTSLKPISEAHYNYKGYSRSHGIIWNISTKISILTCSNKLNTPLNSDRLYSYSSNLNQLHNLLLFSWRHRFPPPSDDATLSTQLVQPLGTKTRMQYAVIINTEQMHYVA